VKFYKPERQEGCEVFKLERQEDKEGLALKTIELGWGFTVVSINRNI